MYRGRLAPSPTGFLHLGHARTFWIAQQRALAANGSLLLRIEDLDRDRCRKEFTDAILEDLKWFGFQWDGTPIFQNDRIDLYRNAFERLRPFLYPCICSRQDVLRALQAPHAGEDEPIYPGTCRDKNFSPQDLAGKKVN